MTDTPLDWRPAETTVAILARLRRMTAEPADSSSYTDLDLCGYLARHALPDFLHFDPYELDIWSNIVTDGTGAGILNPLWTPTYDLNAAAAEVWDEKASALMGSYDVNADGAQLTRSQLYDQAKKEARHYASMAAPRTILIATDPPKILEMFFEIEDMTEP